MNSRRKFIKSGALFVPFIFAPKLIRAQGILNKKQSVGSLNQRVATGGGSDPLPPNVAWWKFDDGSGTTAVDSVAAAHNGTLVNAGSGLPAWTTGHIGGALDNAAANAWVTVAGTISLAGATSEITIAAWLKMDAAWSSGNAAIFGGRASGGNPIFYFVIGNNVLGNNATGKLAALVRDNAGNGLTSVVAGTTLSADTWYHVAITRNSSKAIKIYLDGVEDGSGTDTMGAAVTLDACWLFFDSTFSLPAPLKGILDDVRIYDTALSPTDIATLAGM